MTREYNGNHHIWEIRKLSKCVDWAIEITWSMTSFVLNIFLAIFWKLSLIILLKRRLHSYLHCKEIQWRWQLHKQVFHIGKEFTRGWRQSFSNGLGEGWTPRQRSCFPLSHTPICPCIPNLLRLPRHLQNGRVEMGTGVVFNVELMYIIFCLTHARGAHYLHRGRVPLVPHAGYGPAWGLKKINANSHCLVDEKESLLFWKFISKKCKNSMCLITKKNQ